MRWRPSNRRERTHPARVGTRNSPSPRRWRRLPERLAGVSPSRDPRLEHPLRDETRLLCQSPLMLASSLFSTRADATASHANRSWRTSSVAKPPRWSCRVSVALSFLHRRWSSGAKPSTPAGMPCSLEHTHRKSFQERAHQALRHTLSFAPPPSIPHGMISALHAHSACSWYPRSRRTASAMISGKRPMSTSGISTCAVNGDRTRRHRRGRTSLARCAAMRCAEARCAEARCAVNSRQTPEAATGALEHAPPGSSPFPLPKSSRNIPDSRTEYRSGLTNSSK